MLFAWWRRRKRKKLLESPFPPEWYPILAEEVGHYRLLAEPEQARLRDRLRVFLAEKDWEGCQGLEMTDAVKVTISALAGLLVLGWDDFYFENVQTILVYPEGYVAPEHKPISDEVVLEGETDRLGEAHYRGPVILSWAELQENARRPGAGHNLVFHEFAHQLDMLDGAVDGAPPLPDRKLARRWRKIMADEYERLLDALDFGGESVLDDYAATDPAEFFAVATECFFDNPLGLAEAHPKLYGLFRDFYRQDPARWFG